MSDSLIFEQPLNEKCRLWLRIAHLFDQLDFHLPQTDVWHARAALQALLEIAHTLARADIKPELLKEINRYQLTLERVMHNPEVDHHLLQHILQDLHNTHDCLVSQPSKLGESLRKNDFLNTIQQRKSIPGGCSDFDLPQLQAWLHQPHAERLLYLDDWRNDVMVVREAVDLLLQMIRNSTTFTSVQTVGGLFQQQLNRDVLVQMVRITLPTQPGVFAEISGGRHRFSVRFMQSIDWQQTVQMTQDFDFGLNVCSVSTTC